MSRAISGKLCVKHAADCQMTTWLNLTVIKRKKIIKYLAVDMCLGWVRSWSVSQCVVCLRINLPCWITHKLGIICFSEISGLFPFFYTYFAICNHIYFKFGELYMMLWINYAMFCAMPLLWIPKTVMFKCRAVADLGKKSNILGILVLDLYLDNWL